MSDPPTIWFLNRRSGAVCAVCEEPILVGEHARTWGRDWMVHAECVAGDK